MKINGVTLVNGWFVHVGNNQIRTAASFLDAMDKWFEGYNPPFLVKDGNPEPFSYSWARVRHFYDTKQIL